MQGLYSLEEILKIHPTHMCTPVHIHTHLCIPAQTPMQRTPTHYCAFLHTSMYTWTHPCTLRYTCAHPPTPAHPPYIPADALNLINHFNLPVNGKTTTKQACTKQARKIDRKIEKKEQESAEAISGLKKIIVIDVWRIHGIHCFLWLSSGKQKNSQIQCNFLLLQKYNMCMKIHSPLDAFFIVTSFSAHNFWSH